MAEQQKAFLGAGIQGVKGILHQGRRLRVGHLSSTLDTPAGPGLRERINAVLTSEMSMAS